MEYRVKQYTIVQGTRSGVWKSKVELHDRSAKSGEAPTHDAARFRVMWIVDQALKTAKAKIPPLSSGRIELHPPHSETPDDIVSPPAFTMSTHLQSSAIAASGAVAPEKQRHPLDVWLGTYHLIETIAGRRWGVIGHVPYRAALSRVPSSHTESHPCERTDESHPDQL
jgi:hypothetical protein